MFFTKISKYFFIVVVLLSVPAISLYSQSQNVIFITVDGLRWQEVYSGADSLLIKNNEYVEKPEELQKKFWKNTPTERRKTLMPFFWSTIAKKGQLYGNRNFGNKMNCSNAMWFSYPGYNEILTGFADDKRVNSNDKINNPNVTILEYVNNLPQYNGKVAVFGSWDVFPYIINEERSGLYVNSGGKKAKGNDLSEREVFLNQLQDEIRGPWGTYVRLDVFTHHFALEEMKKNKPKFVYIAYGETDDHAHDGNYTEYLESTHQTDEYIKQLWEYVQSDSFYKDKTTLIITTDHGRGTRPLKTWRDHGNRTRGSGQIWFAAIGAKVLPKGEMKTKTKLYQNQIASTVATALGIKYNQPKAGKPITSVFK